MRIIKAAVPLSLMLVAGCGSEGAGNGNATAAAAPAPAAETSLEEQPVREEHKDLTLRPAWLAGRWQTDEGDCAASDAILSFEPDGRYSFMQDAGRWSLNGDALTIEITEPGPDSGGVAGEKQTVQLRPIGPNEAETRRDDEAPARIYRCHDQPAATAPSAPRP